MFRHVRTERELRAAWRRVARDLHPDLNGHDPVAEDRFKDAHAAYRRALQRIRGPQPVWTPPIVPRSRFECVQCNDTFTRAGECTRCGVLLHDSLSGPKPEPTFDPRVAELEAWLEAPRREWHNPIPEAQRPAAMAFVMVAFGMFHARFGLHGSAVLFLAFAAFALALDGHERFRRLRPEPWRDPF